MTEKIDYEKIGLMCGIEVHQQIDTNKLFCSCPSIVRDDKHEYEVKRNLRAVVGETGEIDVAAAHEQSKEKHFLYYGYKDSTCLVELDEEPPHVMNKEALDIVLQTSLMLNAKIVDEIQVMRKTVIDGSNTTGFQRTALVARGGIIETKSGKVGIPTISIEEESCKIVKREKEFDIYNLSRLGIPLIEIGTSPDIKTPVHAREVAEKLGMILRSTGKVKRGIGTIRQDVNISIKNGVRVEIKGAQDLKSLAKLVENEVVRQQSLHTLSKNIHVSKVHDLTKMLEKTSSKVLRKTLDNSGAVLGIKIEGFSGKFKWEICEGKRFGTELSDYAKAIANVGGLFHTDELPNYGISEDEVESIKKELHVKENDAFIIIADNKKVAEKALEAVTFRIHNPLIKEVRKANEDATTTFLRPMPGAARMYPETDTVPIVPDVKHIKLPELIEDKIKRFEKEYGLSSDIATPIVKEGMEFEAIVRKYKKITPLFIGNLLINTPREIKRRYLKDVDVMIHIDEILPKLENGEITNEAVFEIFVDIANGNRIDYSKYSQLNEKEIDKEIENIISDNKDKSSGAIMGIVMNKFRGKIDGKKVSEIVNRHLK